MPWWTKIRENLGFGTDYFDLGKLQLFRTAKARITKIVKKPAGIAIMLPKNFQQIMVTMAPAMEAVA